VDVVDGYVIVYRLVAIAIVASWARSLFRAASMREDETAPGFDRFPIRMTRNRLIASSILGIVAGLAVLAFSFTGAFPLNR
jgi:predicted metal-binding membrane protein